MPYTKQKNHERCKSGQVAVVNKNTGRLMGCHDSDESADKQIAALMAQEKSSHSWWIDEFAAERVLAGEPVCVLPRMDDGYMRWGTKRDPITLAVLAAVLANFERRESIPGLTRNVPVTIEHDEGKGKIGTLADLTLEEDGLYGTFDFTPRGQELLADGTFDYLSPEIYWEFEDIETGEGVGPAIVGVSVTNYPFFGERTAMYSQKAAERILRGLDYSDVSPDDPAPPELYDLTAVAALAKRHGWQLFDLDDGNGPVVNGTEDQSSLLSLLSGASGLAGDKGLEVMEAVCLTRKGGDNRQYPRSAWLVSGGGPDSWDVRVKSYSVGDDSALTWDESLLLGAGRMVASGDESLTEYAGFLEGMIGPLGKLQAEQEDTMPDGQEQEGLDTSADNGHEEYAQLRADMDALTARLADRDAQISSLQRQRVMDRYTREAEGFSALGVEISDYASHMAWLEHADRDGEHLAFFREALATADAALSQSAAFEEYGTTEEPPVGQGPMDKVDAEVQKLAKEQGLGAVAPGTAEYTRLISEVFANNKSLFAAYRTGVMGKEVAL